MHWIGQSGRITFDTIPEAPDDGKSQRRRKEGRRDDVSLLQLVAIITEQWLTSWIMNDKVLLKKATTVQKYTATTHCRNDKCQSSAKDETNCKDVKITSAILTICQQF